MAAHVNDQTAVQALAIGAGATTSRGYRNGLELRPVQHIHQSHDIQCILWRGDKVRFDPIDRVISRHGRAQRSVVCHLATKPGQLDLAVAGRARCSPDLMQCEIAKDPFVFVCHDRHPLAGGPGVVRLADIEPTELIHLDPDTGSARLLADAPIPDAFKVGGLHAHSTIAQLCLVRAGVGTAILPLNAVRLFNDLAIRFSEIADLDLFLRLYLLLPKQADLDPIARTFPGILEKEVGVFQKTVQGL